MIGTRVSSRLRMSAHDAHYAGELVDGARMLALFGDVATELLIRLDGDEGLFRAYESVEFLAPVFAGDYIEATAELVRDRRRRSRKMRFEARKVIANVRTQGLAPSAADVLCPSRSSSCRALGTCVVPKGLQRRPPELYMPALPAGPEPGHRAHRDAGRVEPTSILTAAIVGAEITRAQTPHLPITRAGRSPTRRRAAATPARRSSTCTSRNDDGIAHAVGGALRRGHRRHPRRRRDCIVQTSTGGAVGMSIDERAGPLACKPGDGDAQLRHDQLRRRRLRQHAPGHPRPRRAHPRGGRDRRARVLRGRPRRRGARPRWRRARSARRCTSSSCSASRAASARARTIVRFMRSLVPERRDVGRRRRRPPPAADDRARDAPRRARARRPRGQHLPRRRACSPRAARRSSARAAAYARVDRARRRSSRRARASCSDIAREVRLDGRHAARSSPTRSRRSARTPRSARAAGDAASFLLESVVGGERWGRYSILGYRPRYEMTLLANGQWVGRGRRNRPAGVAVARRGAIRSRRRARSSSRAQDAPPRDGTAARFAHAYVGYLAWDLVHSIEKVPGWATRRATAAARRASSAARRSSSSTPSRRR